jgi:hypothetical protein
MLFGMTEIERPLTLREAAERSGRHINTIIRWTYSGQLKLCERPLGVRRGKFCTVKDLARACTEKLVPFKQPKRPHLLRKREKDRERWHKKYARTEKTREYKRAYIKWYSQTAHYKKWRSEYMIARRLKMKAKNVAKASA